MQSTSSSESDAFTVSIIIASYNARSLIRQCLHSIIPQADKFGAEVIVVDSSTDSTHQLIQQCFPSLQLHHIHARKLPGQARNIGISHAKGSIIAVIDADCIVDPQWLANIVAAHKSGHDIV